MDPEFLNLKEASKFLKISISTLNRYVREEGIPTYKVGGRRLFDKVELVTWVKTHSPSGGKRGTGNANE